MQVRIAKGDTLFSLARRHGMSLDQLLGANPQIRNKHVIHPGDVLNLKTVPGSAGSRPSAGPAAQATTTRPSASLTPAVRRWWPMIEKAARTVGISPKVLGALVQAESAGNAGARSSVGAHGLTQLMPATARSVGVKNIRDPWQQLLGGARYLKEQLDTFGGDLRKALAAYNAGPGAVRAHGGIPPYAETRQYVRKIMTTLQA
ncbi:MAG: transglycosylase SLT domain-containing protein [Candidatus Sericytochromatia bacterium]|nr:transglycosylase SLT domain-containing protein [Candidatus Sericytochromatia bacterium]